MTPPNENSSYTDLEPSSLRDWLLRNRYWFAALLVFNIAASSATKRQLQANTDVKKTCFSIAAGEGLNPASRFDIDTPGELSLTLPPLLSDVRQRLEEDPNLAGRYAEYCNRFYSDEMGEKQIGAEDIIRAVMEPLE